MESEPIEENSETNSLNQYNNKVITAALTPTLFSTQENQEISSSRGFCTNLIEFFEKNENSFNIKINNLANPSLNDTQMKLSQSFKQLHIISHINSKNIIINIKF